MISLHISIQIYSSTGSLSITYKPRDKCRFRAAAIIGKVARAWSWPHTSI